MIFYIKIYILREILCASQQSDNKSAEISRRTGAKSDDRERKLKIRKHERRGAADRRAYKAVR